MRDEDHRPAIFFLEPQDVVVELEAGDLVERRERLVHQQQRRPGHQCAGDGNAHLHAAGQFARIGLREIGQADAFQRLHDALPRLALRLARKPERQPDIVEHRRPGHQRRLLKHEADGIARSVAAASFRARPVDMARGRRAEARNDAQRRRLAAAGRPEQADELALADIERHVLKRQRAVGEDLGDLMQADDRALRHRLRFIEAGLMCRRPATVQLSRVLSASPGQLTSSIRRQRPCR